MVTRSVVRQTTMDVFGMERFVLWGAEQASDRLQVLDSVGQTEQEAETKATDYLAAHPYGIVYILKALNVLTLRGDPASSGAGRDVDR